MQPALIASLSAPRARALTLGLLLLVAAPGCIVTPPLGELPRAGDAEAMEVVDADYLPFRRAPQNRYAVVMNGRVFQPPVDGLAIHDADDLLKGEAIDDPWVQGDMDQLTRLLLSKGYDVYRLDYGRVTPDTLRALLERIVFVSDDETQVLVAYSGEGDSTGLRTRSMRLGQSRHLVPQGTTITPADLFAALEPVQGRKAVLLNACEAGIFAEEAARWGRFEGVVIAACPRGYATTPHEPSGTTAIFAAFLDLYASDPTRVHNLATVEIDRAGGLWTNLAHHWQSLWRGGGKPISYEPVIFASSDFWF
ncbi:MAG: hypothetical protein KF878_04840 [Planctomycetes bacterium]|nr:hypothetical protein [Planctomycetota bacterium]